AEAPETKIQSTRAQYIHPPRYPGSLLPDSFSFLRRIAQRRCNRLKIAVRMATNEIKKAEIDDKPHAIAGLAQRNV
ncbi:hypothetical protein, partial [Serratia marcescens]|uniref:hypothetical protein n=1 Tax=Serratia marcescens TaxID=615 RepID=UPI001C3CFD22